MTIGERIREYRKSKKMSMAEFGERLGISGQAISQIELGKTVVNERILKSICSEYNVSREWLETGEGEMELLPLDEEAELLADLIKYGGKRATIASLRAIVHWYLSLPDDDKDYLDEAIVQSVELTKKRP